MKKLALFFLFTFLSLSISAQIRFGYLSYGEAIRLMPENENVKKNIAFLHEQYDEETKRAEEDFNRKYEIFLEGQTTFAPVILKKRQAELQDLLNRSISFKKEADRLLKQAEQQLYAPLKAKLDSLLKQIGYEKGYAFILNTDNDGLPFANPAFGEDITELVKEALKKDD
ncbi:MAG: OmpH family outer membrane protein [Prevotella sp.]|nr:OmpH family outer membrane protein [Prevotella sp.]